MLFNLSSKSYLHWFKPQTGLQQSVGFGHYIAMGQLESSLEKTRKNIQRPVAYMNVIVKV